MRDLWCQPYDGSSLKKVFMREELKFGIGDGYLLLGIFFDSVGMLFLLATCWHGIFQGKLLLLRPWLSNPSSEAVLPLQLEVPTY